MITSDRLMYFLILIVVILTAINIVRTIMDIMASAKRDATRSKGMDDVSHQHSGDKFSLYGGSEGTYFGGSGCHKKHRGYGGGYDDVDNLFTMTGGYGCGDIDLLSPTGGDIDSFYGGASTANLVLIKKNGNGPKVWIGQLKEHGNKLQCPGGFVQSDEDMEHCALRGASEMCGKDLVAAYYGKGLCKTSLYKDTPETKRGNVILIISKEEKYNKYDQNEELDSSFSKDSSRLKWIPIKDIIENDSISSDNGECVGIPFYLKRTIQEASKML